MPDFRPAWAPLGYVRSSLVERYRLPEDLTILTGAHDSSVNLYRYLAAGLSDFTLVSTGTWVVAMSDTADTGALDQKRGTSINADMLGNPVGGALTMTGRAFSALAGPDWNGETADAEVIARLVGQGTMALPTFGENDGQFPGSARRGRITGPPPDSQAERTALAVLHSALLTVTCANVLGGADRMIRDGSFLKEPLYAPLVAAIRPGLRTELSDAPYGVVVGAVHLAGHATRGANAPLALETVAPLAVPGLADYASRWRAAADQHESRHA